MTKAEIFEKIRNAIFDDEHEDTVEHVDMSYSEFMSLLKQLAE